MDEKKQALKAAKKAYKKTKRKCVQPWKAIAIFALVLSLIMTPLAVVADMFDKRGVSLVMVHTEHGAEALRHIDMERKDAPYKGALRYNPSIEHSSQESELRHKFWPRFHEVGISAIVELLPARENVLLRLIKRLFHLITR